MLVKRASSGVPLSTERWFWAYMPVWSVVRLGPQGAVLAQWLANRTPVAARASSVGVRTTGWPAAERQSPRHWSTVTKRTFRARTPSP